MDDAGLGKFTLKYGINLTDPSPYEMGFHALKTGNPDDAVEIFKWIIANPDVVQDDEETVLLYLHLGIAHSQLGHLDEAIASVNEAITRNPTFAPAYLNRGWFHSLAEDDDAAMADYSKAIELDGAYHQAYMNRAFLCLGTGDYAQSIADFTQVIALLPEDPDHFVNRGRAYGAARRYPDAHADFQRALALDPHHEEALAYLKMVKGKL